MELLESIFSHKNSSPILNANYDDDTIIINEQRYNDIQLCLDLWVDCHFKLETKYLKSKQGFLTRDYNFIKLLGQSVYYLNVANSLTINSIEQFILNQKDVLSKDMPQKIANALDELEISNRYMRFHNNLIASKIKYYFFRETPMPNLNYPYMSLNKEVVKAGIGLLTLLTKDKIKLNDLSKVVSRYYYYQSLIYSYIFNAFRGYGVFVDFKFSHKNFTEIHNKVDGYLNQLLLGKGLIGVKLFVAKFSCGVMDYYINDPKINNDNALLIDKPECYNNFCEATRSKKIFVEPLTFRLKDILWKLNGILSVGRKTDTANYNDSSYKDSCNEQVFAFVKKYMDISKKMYKKNTLNYYELYKAEKELFIENDNKKGLYSLIFSEHPGEKVREKLKCNELKDESIKCVIGTIKNVNEEEVLSKINLIAKDNESGLKMTKLIQDLSVDDLLSVLYKYAYIIKNQRTENPHEEYVGIYKSGIFLAHMVNMILGQKKCVWLFSTRPYVATLPIHKENDSCNIDSILLFDESLKTGFTYSLYESYVLRNMSKCNIKAALYSVFDFEYYDRITYFDSCLFESIYKVNKSLFVSEKDIVKKNESLKNINKNISFRYKKIEAIIKSTCFNKRNIDLFYLLTDTDSVLSICNDFCKIINIDCPDPQRNIAIFSPSESGDVLAMVLGLLLKTNNRNIIFLQKSNIAKAIDNNSYIVSIDLSMTSGFSIYYTWSIMKNGRYNIKNSPSQEKDYTDHKKKIEDEIDLSLLVYMDTQVKSKKIKALYHKEK